MEKEALAEVDAAEEHPVSLEIGMHRPEGRARRKTLEAFMQLARTDDREHHELVEVGAAALDADLLAHRRMAAVAPDHIVGLERHALGAALLRNRDAHASGILLDGLPRPAERAFDNGKLGHARP